MAKKVQVATPAQHDAKPSIVRSFLDEIAKKHNVRVDDIMVGMEDGSMYVWKYNEGAYYHYHFKVLEIIEF